MNRTPNRQRDGKQGDDRPRLVSLIFAALWSSFLLGAICGALR
jgi:uncharacterized membrane protein YoaK (UPF0700 family)